MRRLWVTAAALLLTAALTGPVLAGQPAQADLSVAKTGAPSPVAAGSDITYTITVQNLGPATATSVNVTDTTPAGTTFVSTSAPAGWVTSTSVFIDGHANVTWSNPSLTVAAGVQTFLLVVTVNPGTPGGTVITNQAFVVASSPGDGNPGNNSATSTLDVAGAATPAPTPAASLADAAMPLPSSGSPLAILGFAVLLVGALSASAVLAVRRARR
jgi:uncharacterized repeat protein (TIGR01451 family)